ncbi:MAG: hypothetical protein ACKVHE_34355 [Planctomycetales bacterium]
MAPDGSLYITDFYNRIIGHYEVKLDDPRRDRLRGRIWRIVYQGSDARRDDPRQDPTKLAEAAPAVDLAKATLEQLFARLHSSLTTQTDLAFEEILRRFGKSAEPAARKSTRHQSPSVRRAALWLLYRLDVLNLEDLARSIVDESPLVRTHAFRVLAEIEASPDKVADWLATGLATGLKDGDALTRRAAAMAATVHRAEGLVAPLLDCFRATPANDVHLRHALRMALRDHLRNENLFAQLTSRRLAQSDIQLIGSLCQSLKTPAAGEFVAAHIAQLAGTEQEQLADYMKFSVRYVSPETVSSLAKTALDQFGNDLEFQLVLLDAVRDGLLQRGVAPPNPVKNWAAVVAGKLLGVDGSGQQTSQEIEALTWTGVAHPDGSTQVDTWTVSRTRKSADGMTATPLWSSFPKGAKTNRNPSVRSFRPACRVQFLPGRK